MNQTDVPLFANRLNSLAEVFGKPPVSKIAMEIWFDTLREFPAERVMDVVNTWAKRNGRFPTPAQVWERVNETCIEEREKKAAFERKQNVGPAQQYFAPTPEGKRICAQLRELFKTKEPPQMRERVPGEDDERVAA